MKKSRFKKEEQVDVIETSLTHTFITEEGNPVSSKNRKTNLSLGSDGCFYYWVDPISEPRGPFPSLDEAKVGLTEYFKLFI